MSMLLLLTSVGISADFHFCKGELKNFALFSKAKSCHEIEAMQSSCCKAKAELAACHKTEVSCDGEEDGCCSNNTQLFQLDVDFSFGQITLEDHSDVLSDWALEHHATNIATSNFTYLSKYQNYKPPLLVEDLPVRFQSFLC